MTSALRRSSCSRSVRAAGLGEPETDVVAERADVGDVVVEPLELEQQSAASRAASWGTSIPQASSTARQ